MSELYTVTYNGRNLYSYEMNVQEKVTVEYFRQELIDICNALDVPREKCVDGRLYMGRLQDNYDFVIKYNDDIGYFVLIGERGMFSMMDGFPIKDKDEAKFILLESEFETGGFRYEINDRDRLRKEWNKKYNTEYDSRKAAFEYVVEKLVIVFKCFPDNAIKKYTDYMNKWFDSQHWYYDKDKMSFEEL